MPGLRVLDTAVAIGQEVGVVSALTAPPLFKRFPGTPRIIAFVFFGNKTGIRCSVRTWGGVARFHVNTCGHAVIPDVLDMAAIADEVVGIAHLEGINRSGGEMLRRRLSEVPCIVEVYYLLC
jgi:hypothetical protein